MTIGDIFGNRLICVDVLRIWYGEILIGSVWDKLLRYFTTAFFIPMWVMWWCSTSAVMHARSTSLHRRLSIHKSISSASASTECWYFTTYLVVVAEGPLHLLSLYLCVWCNGLPHQLLRMYIPSLYGRLPIHKVMSSTSASPECQYCNTYLAT